MIATAAPHEYRTCCSGPTRRVFKIDPLGDPRWPSFLAGNRQASIFQTPGWLRALQRTYGYDPVAFTTSSPDQPLENSIVFCRVKSWLTGERLVSLPFSDHCQPLVEDPDTAAALYPEIGRELARDKCRYVELRPLRLNGFGSARLPEAFTVSEQYYFHQIDLRSDEQTLYASLHRSCAQRKIERAEREHLHYESGRSDSQLAKFYHLLLLTRRRHRLPPQPLAWFRNLVECLGERVTIRVLSKEASPIASILTLSYKRTLVYKYGASNASYHNLGAMPLLFWRAIQEGKQQGAEEFDLGRTEIENSGLAAFKEHLGSTRSPLVYFRMGPHQARRMSTRRQLRIVRQALARMPNSVAEMVGNALYRHMG